MWKLLKGQVRIVRPLNCLMFFAGTYVGGIMAAGADAFSWPRNVPLLLAAFSATLIGAGGNVLNDVYDIEIDRLNRPSRPLPSGHLTPLQAGGLWVTLTIAGLVAAVPVSWMHLGIATTSSGLLFAYNARWKSSFLTGNLLVGIVVAVSLIYGSLSLGGAGPALPAAVFAFLTTMAREIVKDVEDLDGDRAKNSASIAIRSGPDAAARFAAVLLMVTIALTPVPFLILDYSGVYLLLVLMTDGLLLSAVWASLRSDAPAGASRASRRAKLAMVAGLVALAASRISPP